MGIEATLVAIAHYALRQRPVCRDLRYATGTLEEWVKKSEEEFAAIEEEIREICELLDSAD